MLNADDEWVIKMRAKHPGRTITFGIDHKADVTATDIEHGTFGVNRVSFADPTRRCARSTADEWSS